MSRFALLALLCLAAKAPPVAYDAAGAIAAADAAKPRIGVRGRFTMTVAGAGRAHSAVFLNSSADYRAPDDLSLRLSPNVVAALTRRYGMPPDRYFVGRRVVVDGTVRREIIVDENYGRTIGFNRWQHTVRVLFPGQIVSVE